MNDIVRGKGIYCRIMMIRERFNKKERTSWEKKYNRQHTGLRVEPGQEHMIKKIEIEITGLSFVDWHFLIYFNSHLENSLSLICAVRSWHCLSWP